MTQQNAAMVEQANSSTRSLSELTVRLSEAAHAFAV
jgi:methyl-accepting chemotaxis protein